MRLRMPAAFEVRRGRRDATAGSAARASGLTALLVAFAAGGEARAADGSAGAGGGVNGTAPVPAHLGAAAVAVTPLAPLTVLGSGTEAVTCVQSPVAVDAAGRAGVLAPQVGVTVIRGSAAPSPSVTWVVVPMGRIDGGVTVTVCVPAR